MGSSSPGIARAITEPEVLLMDEPCSALDPIAVATEGLIEVSGKIYHHHCYAFYGAGAACFL